MTPDDAQRSPAKGSEAESKGPEPQAHTTRVIASAMTRPLRLPAQLADLLDAIADQIDHLDRRIADLEWGQP